MCDLNDPIPFRGIDLNTTTTVTNVDGPREQGCRVDSIDHGEVEIRQFREPLALMNGVDVGGVWLGGRVVRMTGTVFGVNRADALDRIAALTAIMLPVPGTFGYYPLALTEGTLNVLPTGLHVNWQRNTFGGNEAMPLAIPWSVTMYAKDPDFA